MSAIFLTAARTRTKAFRIFARSRLETRGAAFDIKFSWSLNDVIEVLHCDLDDVILGVVNDTDERDPFCLNLTSQVERGDLAIKKR